MYATIELAEEALKDATLGVGAIKLEAVKVLARIRDQELWREYRHEGGPACTSLDEYLRKKNDFFKRYAGMGARQMQRHMRAFVVLGEQLDFPDDFLLRMGEHALVLCEVAHTDKDLQLQGEDIATPEGGHKLGASHLREVVTEIAAAVEGGWLVKQTKEHVNAILGKQAVAAEVAVHIDAHPAEDEITGADGFLITKFTWTCGGTLVELEDEQWLSRDDFRLFAERNRAHVPGVDLETAHAHMED